MDTAAHENRRGASPRFFAVLTAVTVVITALMVVAVLIGTIQTVARISDGPVWDPLGSYPQQSTDKLVYRPGDDILVKATKCADEHVQIMGSQNWVSADPLGVGAAVTVGAFAAREPGCAGFEYRNPMPAQIVETVTRLERPVRMFISGVETPYDESDPTRIGVPRAWRTNVFTIEPQSKEPS